MTSVRNLTNGYARAVLLGLNYRPDKVFGFLPLTCCELHSHFNSRSPGSYKIEWSGTEMICLNCKTYCTVKEDTKALKSAMKGTNETLENPLTKYEKMLVSWRPFEGVHRGFRMDNGSIKTYEQYKNSITYFYCKRAVMEDGTTTSPLDVWVALFGGSFPRELWQN